MIPEMLNLLGCSKDNFKKLLKSMNYKIIEKNNEYFLNISSKKIKKIYKKTKRKSFWYLKNLNLIKICFLIKKDNNKMMI